MANNNPTIVAASLNDTELRNAIDKLVQYVDDGTKKMAQSMDSAVTQMKNALKGLGNVNISTNVNGGEPAAKQQAVTKAVKETTVAYDDYAKAVRMAYARATKIPTEDIDLAKAKLERLQSILADVNMRKVLSPTQIASSEVEVRKLENRINGVAEAEQRTSNVSNQASQNRIALIEREIAYSQQSIQREEQKREEILRTGRAAQEASQKIIRQMHEQSFIGGGTAITGSKELLEEIRRMRRAYFEMDDMEKQSPIGRALQEDIKKAEIAFSVVQKYNKELMMPGASEGFSSQTNLMKRELEEAMEKVKKLRREYYNLDEQGKKSPMGVALEQEMRAAEQAAEAIRKRNREYALGANDQSLINLRSTLKQLTVEFNNLTAAEIKEGKGDAIIEKYQRLNYAASQVQRTLNRPINLESALKLPQRTLDEIAHKIQMLQNYRAGLKLTDPQQIAEIEQVNKVLTRLQQKAQEIIGSNSKLANSNNALTRSWNYMKNRLAFYFTVGASTAFVKNLIEVRAQYEMNERALGILINSAERGTQIFNELSQMALVSPYTLIELSAAAKQLTAYDVAARDVVDTTRRLADMASAVGVPVERLTYALGQIKAYGYLNSRDARMFANAGIPLVKQLADHYTELEGRMVSTADVYDKIKKKTVGYEDVMQVINRMTDEGGKFFNFQAKMADTLKVKLANLTLAWNNMLNDIGKENQGVLSWTIGALRDLFLHWKDLDRVLKDAWRILKWVTILRLLAWEAMRTGVAFGSMSKYLTLNSILGTKLANVLRTLAASMKTLLLNPTTWLVVAGAALSEFAMKAFGVNEEMKELNESIRQSAENTYKDLEDFAKQYDKIRKSLYDTKFVEDENGGSQKVASPTDIANDDALKAWEAMREQIELSSSRSQDFILQLMSIENVSERLRQGFNLLDDVQAVSAALKEIGDDGIKVEQDWSEWWNLWLGPDGLVGNLKDYKTTLDYVVKEYGSLEHLQELAAKNEPAAPTFLGAVSDDLEKFRKDLEVTTDSVWDFLKMKGWTDDQNKIDEVFGQVAQQLTTKYQLDPQSAFILQQEVEEMKRKAQIEGLNVRIADEIAAINRANDEKTKNEIRANRDSLIAQRKDLEEFGGRNKAYWNDFTKWIKEQHISEFRQMFRDMDAEQIASLDFQKGKYFDFINQLVVKYANEHGIAYKDVFNMLKSYITTANTWSIFIPLTISTEGGKSVLQALKDADADIDAADSAMERLDKRITWLKGLAKRTEDEQGELDRAEKERAKEQEKRDKALERGGISKKDEKEQKAAAKRSAAEAKKRDAAAARAHKQAQSELQGALKNELSLIDEIRSAYKTLTKDGLDRAHAIDLATKGYDETIKSINATLHKYGLGDFDAKKFAGIENPRELVNMLNAQLQSLKSSSLAKPAEIKDLEVKVQKLDIEARSYELKKITDGLNNELGKLKDEYELAIELDADPELGNMFVDMFNIDMKSLPHTFDEMLERAQKIVDDKIKEMGITKTFDLMRDDVEQFAKDANQTIDSDFIEKLKSAQKSLRDTWKKETEDQIKNWDKLLEKYAEYEHKVLDAQNESAKERVDFINKFGNKEQRGVAIRLQTQIAAADDPEERQTLIDDLKDVTREVSDNDETKIHLKLAIDEKEANTLAQIAFEEFQRSPMWVSATGDLSQLTSKALGGLIKELEHYKKSAKHLDAKQIKNLNNALKNLYQQQRKRNPFGFIANAMDEAKERANDYQQAIDKVSAQIAELNKKKEENGELSDADTERYTELLALLTKLKRLQKDVSEISPTVIVEGLNQMLQMANQAITVFTDLADAIGGKGMTDASQTIKNIMGVLEKAGQGAAIGSQIGGGWGAAIGGVAGAVGGLIATFADQWSGNKSITKKIEASERAVKSLANTYRELDYAAGKAYGTQVSGAQATIIANKELQLAEKQRQLELEKSRKSKNKDEDKILDLTGEIIDLKNEILEAQTEIVTSMLGISSAGDEIETLVSTMIDAFKKGEDAMQAFGEEWDKMIDNMVLKLLVTTFMQKAWDNLMATLEEKEKEFLNNANKDNEEAYAQFSRVNTMTDKEIAELVANMKGYTDVTTDSYEVVKQILKQGHIDDAGEGAKYTVRAWAQVTNEEIEEYRKKFRDALTATQGAMNDASTEYTKWALDYMSHEGRDYMTTYAEMLKNALGDWYTYGQENKDNLSALQQGIQGITEDTAGAIEAYLNIIAQRVFEHGNLLTEIRDAVVTLDMDVQLGTLSQMLLQMQASYQVQMTIQGLLQGWSTPNGMAVRVELNN